VRAVRYSFRGASFAGIAAIWTISGAVHAAPLTGEAQAPSSVDAAPTRPASAFEQRRLAFEGHLGFGTPVGELGFVTEYSPWPLFGIGAGVGYGSGSAVSLPNFQSRAANHLHLGAVTRFRPLRDDNDALALGAAYSVGGYKRLNLSYADGYDDEKPQMATWAHWVQFDVGWEHRAGSGFLLRVTVGLALMLNPGDMGCLAICNQPVPSSENIPTIDVALGYAL